MTPRPLPAIVRDVATEALALASTLAEAEEVQWKPSIVPKPREDTAERSRGEHSDPTPTTVADPRRLAVRDAVLSATAALELLVGNLIGARERVEQALDAWNGADF